MASYSTSRLLQSLCRRPDLAERLRKEPDSVFAEFGIDERERAALRQPSPEALGAIDWSEAPWPQLVSTLKERTGRAGKALFRPLRLALTGRESGPEMAALLPLIGPEKVALRLKVAAG